MVVGGIYILESELIPLLVKDIARINGGIV
jgi:hypothetical protein